LDNSLNSKVSVKVRSQGLVMFRDFFDSVVAEPGKKVRLDDLCLLLLQVIQPFFGVIKLDTVRRSSPPFGAD